MQMQVKYGRNSLQMCPGDVQWLTRLDKFDHIKEVWANLQSKHVKPTFRHVFIF